MRSVFLFAVGFVVSLLIAGRSVDAEDSLSPVSEHLKELECFVGIWEAEETISDSPNSSATIKNWAGKKYSVRMTVKWAPNKSAQIIEFVGKYPDGVTIIGSGLRGWDQSANAIREYSFTSHKGVWSGTLTKTGNVWVSKYAGMNLDGAHCSGSEASTFESADAYVSRENSEVEGKAIPERVMRFTRVKPKR